MRSATLLATAVLLTGCGSDTSGIVRLRAGTVNSAEHTSAQALQEFAREAERRSGGRIRVEPERLPDGSNRVWLEFDVSETAQGIAAQVASGEFDLAMVPADSLDAEGIKGLRALHAPFLVTSDALLARIARSPLAGEMLAELDDAGLVGLALVPIGLRHPFWHVTTLADFAGTSVYAPRSDVAFALFRALGARPNEGRLDALPEDTPPDSVVRDNASFPPTPRGTRGKTVTANVTFAPEAQVLVISRRAWDRLDGKRRAALREAARRMLEHAIDTAVPEAERARRFCADDGRVTLAPAAAVAQLEAAARPVYAELERDARTRDLIAGIRALAREVEAAPLPVACGD